MQISDSSQDGFLQKIGNALDRMSELSVLSQDVTKTDSDRGLYDKEFQTLSAYVSNTATKDFNGVSLFSGTTLNVTSDSDGNTFSNVGVNLSNTTYTTATGSSISTACCSRSGRWRGARSSAAAGATSTHCSPACSTPDGSRSSLPHR